MEHGRVAVVFGECVSAILGARVSSVGAISRPKLRFVHDFTFTAPGGTSSVNVDTFCDAGPAREWGHVSPDVILRVLYLRQLHGPKEPVLLGRIDVRVAYRQVLVDPKRPPIFTYVIIGDLGIIALSPQVGW